jgi:DNA-binding SARP family transcriptional activator
LAHGGGLRISLLGEFGAAYDGAALDLGGPRQRAVLALLVLSRGQTVSAERIIDSLWEDEPPTKAFPTMQSYVSHLRRRLEPGAAAHSRAGVIVRRGRGYAVRLPADAVDAWRFEQLLSPDGQSDAVGRLTEALDLWRGRALAEYADQPWAQPEITRLEELRSVARERLAAARLERGEAAVLVADLEALVAEQPLREERWRLLTLALYRAHRQADALGALRRARQTFADELGIDPGPALRALEADVLAQSPALDPRAPAATSAGQQVIGSGNGASTDLVDRGRELAQVRQALSELALGRPTQLLLEGPAGIGKTRLLDELRGWARAAGVRVLAARGSQLEQSFGYGVVRQLLEPAITEELLEGSAAPARAVFDLASEHGEGSLAVLHALYSLTAHLAAESPLLLSVDNLQWSDGPSLRYLAYLARRLDGLPVIVATTLRSGEPHDHAELLADLTDDAHAVMLRPQPLSEEATNELVCGAFGRSAAPLFVAACHRTTAGNPLLLRQLLQALVTEDVKPDAAHAHAVLAVGSRAVSSQVLMRLRRMPAECQCVARSVAILGDAAQLPHVAALAGLTEPETARAIATLTRAGMLRDDDPIGFVHPVVADAVYRDLAGAERGLEHERAAGVLGARGAGVERVAAHLLLAPCRGDPATVDVLRSAARKAADRAATDSAVTYLRRALDEPPDSTKRSGVLLELGMQEALIDGRACTTHLAEAYPLIDDPDLQVRVAMAIAHAQVFACERGAAVAFARDAAQRLPPGSDDARDGLVALLRIAGIMQSVDPALWRDPDVAEPGGAGVGARMLYATLSWEAVLDGRDRARAVRLAREAIRDDRLWQADTGLLWCIAGASRMYADDDLGEFWLRSRTMAHARGSLFAVLSVNQWEGVWRWRRGELAEAAALIGEAQEQDRMWGGSGIGLAYSYGALVAIELDRGAVANARLLLDAAPAEASYGDGGRLLRQVAAGVLLAERRFAEAIAAIDQIDDPVGIANPAWSPWRRLRAAALHGMGRTDEAIPLLEEEVHMLRRWGAPSSLGVGLTKLGVVSGRLEPLREAVSALETSGAALALSRARLALGRHPDVAAGDAVSLLREAVDGAAACGAQGAVRQACGALRRLGQSPPDGTVRQAASTATQQRAKALAERGMGVEEIAQALFLTPQTVHAALAEPTAAVVR